MRLNRKVALTSFIFLGISVILTFTLALLSDYRYNDITYIGEEELRSQVIEDLDIEGDYFLLTPKLWIDYKLNKLEYLKNAYVEKVLPNTVVVTYEINSPSFCDNSKIYFEDSTILIDEENVVKCEGVPQLISIDTFREFEAFVKEYEALSIFFRSEVASVDSIDNYYQFEMNNGLLIKVFLEDFINLNRYNDYKSLDNLLDLRPKYS